MDRRTYLAALGASAVTLSGCSVSSDSPGTTQPPSESPTTQSVSPTSSRSPEASDKTSTPTPAKDTPKESPTPVVDGRASPAPSCRNGYTSIEPWWVVEGTGPLGGFNLTLNDDEIAHGDTLIATLTNVTSEQGMTGNKKKYDIQYHGEDGWHTIFGTERWPVPYTDEGVIHQPGEGFTWELTFTQDGLTDAVGNQPTYYVCEPLEPGTYRFVYWGISTEREEDTNYETDFALGVPFSLSQD